MTARYSLAVENERVSKWLSFPKTPEDLHPPTLDLPSSEEDSAESAQETQQLAAAVPEDYLGMTSACLASLPPTKMALEEQLPALLS